MRQAASYAIDWDEIGDEEWRRVPGFPNYEVSELGQVRNANTRAVLKPLRNPRNGRLYICLTGRKRRAIHQLVALAFIGPCPEGETVDHLDGDKVNNRATNLEYCTRAENTRRYHDRVRAVIKSAPARRARRTLSPTELADQFESERWASFF